MHHFCSHIQSVSFVHVAIEMLASDALNAGETSEKHLSCPESSWSPRSVAGVLTRRLSASACLQHVCNEPPHFPPATPRPAVTLATGKQGHAGSMEKHLPGK